MRTSGGRLAVEGTAPGGRIPVDAGLRLVLRTHDLDLVVVGLGDGIEERAEAPVGDDLGAELAPQGGGLAEVVGMGVGDDHRVDPLDGVAGSRQPLLQRLPGGTAGETRVDQGQSVAVLDDVAVHVAESGQ